VSEISPTVPIVPVAPIPANRALIPHPAAGRVPARRQVSLSVRSLHLARIARAAGAVAVGFAAKSVLRALLERRERGLATASGALIRQRRRALTPAVPAMPSVSVAQPFEASRVIEQFPGAARLVITELTVIERRRRR
jgi:hypothetical protein